jgi:ABC-type sugar transport system substrate-binding protein
MKGPAQMKAFLFAALAAIVVMSIGCESKETASSSAPTTQAASSSGGGGEGKKIRVAMLPKKLGVPYFTTCADGAQAAAKELGNVELIYDGPTDGSAEKAASMIGKWTLQGVDVIAVSPNDPDVLAAQMKKAREKGIHVITWDADGAPDTREFFVNQATAQQIGYKLVDTLAADIASAAGQSDPMQASGNVAIITATLTAANQNQWMNFMKERLKEYPNLKLVEVKPSNEDQKLAFQTAQDLMKAYPDLKGIWAISSVAFPGAAEAIKQANMVGKVQVTGLSTPNDMRSFVEDGTVKSVILWNTNDLGYLTVRVARAVVDGKIKAGDATFSAGKLGDKKVAGDNVLLGDILVFTKENIGKFNF